MDRMYHNNCIFTEYVIVFFFTLKVVLLMASKSPYICMVNMSKQVVFQDREAVVNQDGNFNIKGDFHFVLLIIDFHCTLFTILLHRLIPESNKIIRIEKFESKYFNQTSS